MKSIKEIIKRLHDTQLTPRMTRIFMVTIMLFGAIVIGLDTYYDQINHVRTNVDQDIQDIAESVGYLADTLEYVTPPEHIQGQEE